MTPEHVGPYTPLHYLGHGGMAIVYLAEHRRTGARVALKLAQRGHSPDVLVRRFEHERRTLEVKEAIRDREPELDVRLAAGLAEILSKALSKDPARRFRGAARLASAVLRYNFRQRIGWNYPEGREGMLLAAI